MQTMQLASPALTVQYFSILYLSHLFLSNRWQGALDHG